MEIGMSACPHAYGGGEERQDSIHIQNTVILRLHASWEQHWSTSLVQEVNSESQSCSIWLLADQSGQPECLFLEGLGRKLFFHTTSVKKSFPFHIQTEVRPHWANDLRCSSFPSKTKCKISSSIRIAPLSGGRSAFFFQPLLYLDDFPVRLLPHVASHSWVTWLPGSLLLLCDILCLG